MTKRNIVYYGDPVLRKKTEEVTAFDETTEQVVQDLFDTIKDLPAWGLAAPQIGESKRIFVTSVQENLDADPQEEPILTAWINPVILSCSEESWERDEACISIPGVREIVSRPYTIEVAAYDIEGNRFEVKASGWHAKIFLHEHDHLNGVLFIDRIDKKRRKKIETKLRSLKQGKIPKR